MEPITIYLDESDPRKMRSFWILQSLLSLFWIYQGYTEISAPGKFAWPHGTMMGLGIALLVLIGINVYLQKNGRPHLLLADDGLKLRIGTARKVKQIRWDEIARIDLKLNQVEIHLHAPGAAPIQFPLGSYAINQTVKQSLRESASSRGIDVSG